MLPGRPSPRCHQALLKGHLFHPRLEEQWCGGSREGAGEADAQGRTTEGSRHVLSLCTLRENCLAMKREKEKGMLLPVNMPYVHLMHAFELLNRWKPSSLLAGENL